jgi:large subunit ribosomal protein L29
MKFAKIKELSPEDREKKLVEAKKDLLKLNGQVATGTVPKSPGQIKELKRTIAKIKSLKE